LRYKILLLFEGADQQLHCLDFVPFLGGLDKNFVESGVEEFLLVEVQEQYVMAGLFVVDFKLSVEIDYFFIEFLLGEEIDHRDQRVHISGGHV
jgi:hypothetical protein